MSGDSSAEVTVEQHDQSAMATSPEVPTARAEDSVQEAVAEVTSGEQPVRAEGNGHADTNGHGTIAEAGAQPAAVETPGDRAAPIRQAPAGSASSESAAAAAGADTLAPPRPDRPPPPITPDVEKPAFGPRILGVAEPVKPLPSKKSAAPPRKRRRRPSAAERHRRAFFSALTDLRRGGSGEDAATEAQAPQAEAIPQQAVTPATPEVVLSEAPASTEVPEAPVAPEAHEAPVAPEAQEVVQAETPATSEAQVKPPPASAVEHAQADDAAASPARLAVAVERVGGPEVIKEALKPKQDEKGQPLKWAAVCAQAAEGLKPGDPVFNAWVRLAATPVREVKGQLPRPAEQARPAGREGGRRNNAQRAGGGAGGRRDRGRSDDRPKRQEYTPHAHDGSLRKSVRIVTGHDEDQERRERERVRKEQREAKRRTERERLARLGY